MLAIAAASLSACSSNSKKALVLLKGDGTVDEKAKAITLKDGAGTKEVTVDYNTGDKVTMSIKKEGGEVVTVDIPEKGYYLLNAKADTVIGSYQKYTVEGQKNLTQDQLKRSIDSLTALTEGKIPTGAKAFFVLPFSAVKVTENKDAIIVAPFHQMMRVEQEGDKQPEIYRFWNIQEIRETIAKLIILTKPVHKLEMTEPPVEK